MEDDRDLWGLILAALFAMASTYGLLLLLLSEEWTPLRYWSVSAAVIIGYVVTFFTAMNWIMPRFIYWYESIGNIATRTENVRIWEAAERMSQEQIRAIDDMVPKIHWIGGKHGPMEYLWLGEGRGEIPMWFIKTFLEASSTYYCVPVGEWSEGTHERAWAQAFTAYLCSKKINLAEPAAGNLSAKWVDGMLGRENVAIWCGVKLADVRQIKNLNEEAK